MNVDLKWLENIHSGLKSFLDFMAEDNYTYFKYSYSGDIYGKNIKWGLGNIAFAVKILYISGLLEHIDKVKKENLFNGIMRFSEKKGYIFDPIISDLKKSSFLDFNKKISPIHEEIRRAETRQSFAAISLLEEKPDYPFKNIPYNTKGVRQFLSSMNWANPWASGSHFSHLLFFLKANSLFFDYKIDLSEELIKIACEWIGAIQSKEDGTWHSEGDISLSEKINGAMKIMTGLHAAGMYDIPYAKKIIDTALSGINDEEACSNFNISYVLYGASIVEPEYRKDEINEFLLNRINLYREYYYPDKGGFSFRKNSANDNYYGKIISLGKDEPDIHGTIMFTWGIAIIDNILGLGINFKIPFN